MTWESVVGNLETDIENLSERIDAIEIQLNGVTQLLAQMHIDLHAHLSDEDQEDAPG